MTGLLLLGIASAAEAQTYTVTRTDDPVPGPCLPADCSLREALKASDESTTVADDIVVPAAAAHYQVDLGSLPVEGPVEVRGAGADRVVLDAGGNSIAVGVGGQGALLEGLTITGGLGGIQHNGANLILRRVAIEHNDRTDGGGGAIQSNGPLTVESSFIGFNSTNGIAGGAIQGNEPLTIVNSTFASNTSLGPDIMANDEARISSSAIVFNTSLESGNPAIGGGGPVTLTDDIIAGNRNPDGTENCGGGGPFLISIGGNVVDDATCSPGPRDRANTPPGLGTLELHGGTTPVFSLLPGSAAVDFALSCPPTDQRGAPRPQGAACDSGPFELEPAPASPTTLKDESVSILIGRGKVRINSKGRGRVRLTCPQSEQSPPCSGTLRLSALTRKALPGASAAAPIAKAKFKLGAGATKRVKVHLSSATVDLIRESPAARRISAVAKVADAAGNHGMAKRRLRLVPPK